MLSHIFEIYHLHLVSMWFALVIPSPVDKRRDWWDFSNHLTFRISAVSFQILIMNYHL